GPDRRAEGGGRDSWRRSCADRARNSIADLSPACGLWVAGMIGEKSEWRIVSSEAAAPFSFSPSKSVEDPAGINRDGLPGHGFGAAHGDHLIRDIVLVGRPLEQRGI